MHDEIETISRSASLEEVRLNFRRVIEAEGFTASACGAFIPTENGPETHFFFTDWPDAWIKLYVERNYVAYDYSVAEARQRISPFTWLEAKAGRVLSGPEQELWKTANEWGWSDGFAVPIHGPGGYFGLVNIAGTERAWPAALHRSLHMLCLATHDRCRTLAGMNPVTGPRSPLTVREIECLRWIASGKTDAEIAEILGISQATVKFHVDGARAKLDARNRAHAVARLVLFGLA